MRTSRSLSGPAWLSLLLLLLMDPATAVTHKTVRETSTKVGTSPSGRVTYLTPGCKKMNKLMKEHVGMCASDSIEMKIDGQIALLLDQKPWSVSGLADTRRRALQTAVVSGTANPDVLLYILATTVIDGPLDVQNLTVGGYFKIGNITLGPDSDMSALQGPAGPPG